MSPNRNLPRAARRRAGFSLVEVLLALTIFAISILAMVGLLVPTLDSVGQVSSKAGATAVVTKINAFLQESRFENVYNLVSEGKEEALVAYTVQPSVDEPDLEERISPVRQTGEGGEGGAEGEGFKMFTEQDDIVGPVYKVFLKASPFYRGQDPTGTNIDGLNLPPDIVNYPEGFLNLTVSVYVVPNPLTGAEREIYTELERPDFAPILEYPTAITR